MCGVLGSVDEIWGRGEELNSAGCYGGVDCVIRLSRSDLLFYQFLTYSGLDLKSVVLWMVRMSHSLFH